MTRAAKNRIPQDSGTLDRHNSASQSLVLAAIILISYHNWGGGVGRLCQGSMQGFSVNVKSRLSDLGSSLENRRLHFSKQNADLKSSSRHQKHATRCYTIPA